MEVLPTTWKAAPTVRWIYGYMTHWILIIAITAEKALAASSITDEDASISSDWLIKRAYPNR